MAGAGTQDRSDELAGVPIEDQERMVHIAAVIPMVGNPFLLAVRRIICAVEVEDDAIGNTIPLPLVEVELHQGDGEAIAGFVVDGILQAGERRLAGKIILIGKTAADQLQERITAEMIGVILVFVATGDLAGTLWVPLTDQGLQGMANRVMPPLGNLGSQRGTETESSIRFEQPTKAAIGGEVRTVKPGLEGGRGEAKADRLGHEASPGEALLITSPYPVSRDASFAFIPP